MFSNTTMASSTNTPMASESPSIERVLTVNPTAFITMKAAKIQVGIASATMSVPRKLCKKMYTMAETKNTPRINVNTTSAIASSTVTDSSNETVNLRG